MTEHQIAGILSHLGITDFHGLAVSQYHSEETGEPYEVYSVTAWDLDCVLKRAKADEAENYATYLSHNPPYAPKLYGRWAGEEGTWLLMERVDGESLLHCTTRQLMVALDSLIAMQSEFWQTGIEPCAAALEHRRRRRDYLRDPLLERAYDCFLQMFEAAPKTLCHDDLLPFNVIVSDHRAVMIDWEAAGIMAYPTSLARLIAHGSEEPENLFYMTDADRKTAIDYYYDKLLRSRGITYEEYRRTLDLAVFYEYCEWVYVGNKYGDTQSDYYQKYRVLARKSARSILSATGGGVERGKCIAKI